MSILITEAPETSPAQPSRRLLRISVGVVALAVILVLPLVALVQPVTSALALRATVSVISLAGIALLLDHLGHRRRGAALFVTGLMLLIAINSLDTGGIRSPGVQAWFVIMLLAGVLLGLKAGLIAGLATALLSLGLVLAETSGRLPPMAFEYLPLARWLVTVIYLSLATFLLWLWNTTTRGALDRARAELTTRRQAELRLEQALSAGMIGTFEHDLASDRYQPDGRTVALTGLRPEGDGRVPLSLWLAQIEVEDRPGVEEALRRFATGGTGGRMPYRYRHPATGDLLHLEAALYVSRDPQGVPRSLTGMLSDVTAREQAILERAKVVNDLQERLKELGALHDIAGLLQEGARVDRDRLQQLASCLQRAMRFPDHAMVRVVWRDQEVISSSWPPTSLTIRGSFESSAGAGTIEIGYGDVPIDDTDSLYLPEEVALLTSVTEMLRSHLARVAAEADRSRFETQLRQSEKMGALGRLAGGIAHDFNNILSGLGQHADLAAEVLPTDDPARESVVAIRAAVGRGRDLVQQILDFSRQRKLRLEPTDLGALLEEVGGLLKAGLPPGFEITTVVSPDLPRASVDAGRLHQVLMNLGTNAIQAMAPAGGVLRFEASPLRITDARLAPAVTLREGTYVVLEVRDTGPGIPPDLTQHLFEPFFTTKGERGTGLGLAVVHSIVADHGGAILVESESGAGTTFRIYLPADNTVRGTTTVEQPVLPRGRGQLVLVVDDDSALLSATGRTLGWLGYRCGRAESAEAAVALIADPATQPDAVLTDLNLPGMDGAALYALIRRTHPAIPIAIISGSTPILGMSDDRLWVPKPASLAELASALERMLG